MLKRFYKECVNFNNIKTLLIIDVLTYLFSSENNRTNHIIVASVVYIVLLIIVWQIASNSKKFRDFFTKK